MKGGLSFSVRQARRQDRLRRDPGGQPASTGAPARIRARGLAPHLREAPRLRGGRVRDPHSAGRDSTPHRPRLRNNLDVNFGVTEAVRAAGMAPGTTLRRREPSRDPVGGGGPGSGSRRSCSGVGTGQIADGRPVVFQGSWSRSRCWASRSSGGWGTAPVPTARAADPPSPARRRDAGAGEGRRVLARRLDVKSGALLLYLAAGRLRPRGQRRPFLTRASPRPRPSSSGLLPRSWKEVSMTLGKSMRLKRRSTPPGSRSSVPWTTE